MKLLKGIAAGLLLLLSVGVLYFAAALLSPLELPPAASGTGSFLLRDVQLVDLQTGEVHASQDVRVEDGSIAAIADQLPAANLPVIEGRGRYLLPGLFDMHTHSMRLAPYLSHPLQIAAGVTAVRDMGGCLGEYDAWSACAADKRRWHRSVTVGAMVGPRYDQVTSLAINGGSEIPAGWDPALGAATVAGARARVAHDAARGIDFLKPYSMLAPEAYLALVQAAAEQGLYLAGHRPVRVPAATAIAAGQRSIEHAFLFIWECFPGMDELRHTEDIRSIYSHEMRVQMLDGHDEEQCQQLHAQMVERGTAFVPTHTTRKLDAFALDEDFRSDPRLRYIPSPLRLLWLGDADGMAARTDAQGYRSYRRFYEFGLQQTGAAHRAGVTVLAGTDAPDSFAFPGFALHDELGHLVEAGLTPLQALRAATVEAARFLGLEGEAGVISPGARADLLLLPDNPLEDIEHIRGLDTVVLAGRIYDRPALDALLQYTERTASHWSMWPRFVWLALRSPIFRAQFKD